jgi:hypothetical protein
MAQPDLMERFESDVDDIVAVGPSYFSDAETLRRFHHQMNRLDAIKMAAIAEFDLWGGGAADGAKNTADWLSKEFKEPVKESRRRVKHGQALKDLPIVADAMAKGEINQSHLDLFLKVRNPQTKDAMTLDEAHLVEEAKRHDFPQFTRAMAYWEQGVDPDGVEDDALAERERRDTYLAPTGGRYQGRMSLDLISGAIVADELGRLEQDLFEADWAEAKERLGHDPTVFDLARTPAQRRADALVEMAIRSRTAPADGRRPVPLFSALVDFPTLNGRICELANGVVVTPGALVPWLDQAYIERAVYKPDGRIEVSETARFFTGATRRALELRDRRCTHPYCNEPVERCQADHIVMASQGGPTTQENGRLLCAFHNRLRNQRPPPDD